MIGLLSRIYLALHHFVFRRRKEGAVKFEVRVVSVGNLSMGGTGKTPLVAYLAEKARKRNPMVVLRGYGGRSAGLVSDGRQTVSTFDSAGDEAMLLAQVPGLRVAAGRDRIDLIRRFAGNSGIIFLDDAFQNPSIARDVDLVLIDATLPPERLRVFPGGKFREDVDALLRASAVLLTRSDSVHARSWLSLLRTRFPSLPIFQSVHEFAGLVPFLQSTMLAATTPEQKQRRGSTVGRRTARHNPNIGVGAFCGIGNPQAFYSMLAENGMKVVSTKSFGDHHRYTAPELTKLIQGSLRWITTEKDAVRIRDLDLDPSVLESIWIARLRLRITVGEKSFLKLVLG
ncbi:MAG: tetraacyldisaccharide 4'-kinase [Leptospirales bacterium]|nr:tetraacyldisaccharide 4'-kinase [Leptospirales bacterium]